jgi:hypothetical protein
LTIYSYIIKLARLSLYPRGRLGRGRNAPIASGRVVKEVDICRTCINLLLQRRVALVGVLFQDVGLPNFAPDYTRRSAHRNENNRKQRTLKISDTPPSATTSPPTSTTAAVLNSSPAPFIGLIVRPRHCALEPSPIPIPAFRIGLTSKIQHIEFDVDGVEVWEVCEPSCILSGRLAFES